MVDMLCSEAILINQDASEGHATVLRCKRWSCELCNPFNHRRIKRKAREGLPNTFLTLTVNPARYQCRHQAARDLKTAWVNMRRAMERDHAIRHPPFIAVFEETKQGWPHLHILMRCKFIDQKWYSETMRRLTGAYITHVRYVPDVGRVAAYVAKYVSKAPEAFQHCKRWWRSHDYAVDVEECQPFKRFGPYVHEFTGKVDQWLWKSYGGSCRIVESREGYWRWVVPDKPKLLAYEQARA